MNSNININIITSNININIRNINIKNTLAERNKPVTACDSATATLSTLEAMEART